MDIPQVLVKWLIAVGIAFGVGIAFVIVRSILEKRLSKLAARFNPMWERLVFQGSRRIPAFVVVIISIYCGSLYLDLPSPWGRILESAAVLAGLFQVGRWGGLLIDAWFDRLASQEADGSRLTTFRGFSYVLKVIAWSLVILSALSNLGVDVTALVAGLGIGGIAVALAVQNVLGDLLASFSIILDKPFVVGDYVVIDDVMGDIEYVGLKTTRIRSLSGELIIFPNSLLLGSRVRNFQQMNERRINFTFGVIYQTSSKQLRAITKMVEEIFAKLPDARLDRVHFVNFGSSSLDFEVVYYVLSPQYRVYRDTHQAVNHALFERFEKEGIEFAYPTQTVFVEKGSYDFKDLKEHLNPTQS